MTKVRWFSFREDGKATGQLVCEPCAKINFKDAPGLTEVKNCDWKQSCVYCFRPSGNFNRRNPLIVRK